MATFEERQARAQESISSSLKSLSKTMEMFNKNIIEIAKKFEAVIPPMSEKAEFVDPDYNHRMLAYFQSWKKKQETDPNQQELKFTDNSKRVPLRLGIGGEVVGEAVVDTDSAGNLCVTGVIPDPQVALHLLGDEVGQYSLPEDALGKIEWVAEPGADAIPLEGPGSHNYVAGTQESWERLMADFQAWRRLQVRTEDGEEHWRQEQELKPPPPDEKENVLWVKPGQSLRVWSKAHEMEGTAVATDSNGRVQVQFPNGKDAEWIDREELDFLDLAGS